MAAERLLGIAAPLDPDDFFPALKEGYEGLWQRAVNVLSPVTGGPSAYTASVDPTLLTLTTRSFWSFRPPVTSSLAPTLNIAGTGAFPFRRSDGTTLLKPLLAGVDYLIRWDGSFYRVAGTAELDAGLDTEAIARAAADAIQAARLHDVLQATWDGTQYAGDTTPGTTALGNKTFSVRFTETNVGSNPPLKIGTTAAAQMRRSTGEGILAGEIVALATYKVVKISSFFYVFGLPPLEIAAETAARIAADEAETARRTTWDGTSHRPGDVREAFTHSLDGGDPAELDPIDADLIVVDANEGSAIRLSGELIVARRAKFPLEPGRKYKVQWAYRRETGTPDPANDAVTSAVAWFGYNKARLSDPSDTTEIDSLDNLVPGPEVRLVTAIIARSALSGVTHVAPAAARYWTPYSELFGTHPETDLVWVRAQDITDLEFVAPNVDAISDRLFTLESANLNPRLTAAEAALAGAEVNTFKTVAAAEAETPIVSVDKIVITDPLEVYERVASDPGAVPKLQTADGEWWRRTHGGASEDDALAGTNDVDRMTPEKVAAVIKSKEVYATHLGIVGGDVDANEAPNETALNAFFASAGSFNTVLLWNIAGITRIGNLVKPQQRAIVGLRQLSAVELKSGALSGPAIQVNGYLTGIENVYVTATAARIAAAAADAYGIRYGTSANVSMFGTRMQNVRIYDQPAGGVQGWGDCQQARFWEVEIARCGKGFVWEPSASGAGANGPFGMCEIGFLRSFNNRGHGLQIGNATSAGVGYRWANYQPEVNDNCWDPDWCLPKHSGTLGSNPFAAVAGATATVEGVAYGLLTVTQTGGHRAHRGDWIQFANAPAYGIWSQAQMRAWTQVYDWTSDTTYRVLMPSVDASGATAGGGAGVTFDLRSAAQAYLATGSSLINHSAYGNSQLGGAHDTLGLQKMAARAIFWRRSLSCRVIAPRFIEVDGGMEFDSEGTPSGNQATSLTAEISCSEYVSINAVRDQGKHLFIIPKNALGTRVSGPGHSGHLHTVFTREQNIEVIFRGERSVGVASATIPETTQLVGYRTLVTHSLVGGTLSTRTDFVSLAGQGGVADDLENILIGGAVPPAGTVVRVYNPNAYFITVVQTGNIFVPAGIDSVIRQYGMRLFVSDGTRWVMTDLLGALGAYAGIFETNGVTDGKDILNTIVRSSRASASAATHYQFHNQSGLVGSISTAASATAYNTSSDERRKTRIRDLADPERLVRAIHAREFDWKAGGRGRGFVAQEVLDAIPEAEELAIVTRTEEGEMLMDYSKLVPFLWGAFRKLEERVDAMEASDG